MLPVRFLRGVWQLQPKLASSKINSGKLRIMEMPAMHGPACPVISCQPKFQSDGTLPSTRIPCNDKGRPWIAFGTLNHLTTRSAVGTPRIRPRVRGVRAAASIGHGETGWLPHRWPMSSLQSPQQGVSSKENPRSWSFPGHLPSELSQTPNQPAVRPTRPIPVACISQHVKKSGSVMPTTTYGT